jgi:ArsR family transcriptional regulator
MDEQSATLHRTLNIFKALAVETRLRLLLRLLDGERCVCELYPGLGEQSNVSRHLIKLKELGIVKRRDDAQRHYYSIADERIDHMLRKFGLRAEKTTGSCEVE